jgi:hypothetical protein
MNKTAWKIFLPYSTLHDKKLLPMQKLCQGLLKQALTLYIPMYSVKGILFLESPHYSDCEYGSRLI